MIHRRRSAFRDYRAEAWLFRNRAVVSFLAIIISVALLVANLYNIQVNQFQDYKTRSNDNRIKIVPIAPNRGLIYDRNGVLLAENQPIFNLEIIPEQVNDMDDTIARLKAFLPVPQERIDAFKKESSHSRRFKSVPLLLQLTPKQVAVFSVNQHKFPGVSVNANLKRHYPFSEVLTHVIGYVSRINDRDIARLQRENKEALYQATRDIGKLGVERYYEDILHGIPGYQEVEVNSRGRIIRTLKYVPPVPGKDIVLNLDIELQQYVTKLLHGRRGSAVVLDPLDNGVLAMVSSPSYDPNSFVHGISSADYRALLEDTNRPLVNRATLGIYPPASTVKPFIAVAALQEGVVTPSTTRSDPGYWRIPNSKTKPYRDWLRWGHGKVNITKAIEESVDTFFYQIAFDLGIDRLSVWMQKFGYGEYTGIDIFEESKANMPTRDWKRARHKDTWYQGDTIPVGIGQGYWTATPMQIAKATSVLVHHGEVLAPHLLRATIDNGEAFDKQMLADVETYPPITNVPEKYWDIAINGMYLVNHGTRGTARKAFKDQPFDSAGKSGTAQVFGLAENEEYNADDLAEHLHDHALFTGFAPVKDPKVIVSVVLENAGGGSSNGAPVAHDIFSKVILNKETIIETPEKEVQP